MRKTRRGIGRYADLYVIHVSPTTEHRAEFHTREELKPKQREKLRSIAFRVVLFVDNLRRLPGISATNGFATYKPRVGSPNRDY
jgi:hypothetical protein